MDRYEGVAGGHYDHIEVRLLTDDDQELSAVTYVAGPNFVCAEGRPSEEYLGLIICGARQHGLPDSDASA